MLLNAQNIMQFLTPSEGVGGKAQVGYDLSIKNITKIIGGNICKTFKEIMPYEQVVCNSENTWELEQGVYSLTFNEGIKLDSTHSGFVIHKSSILRCGGFITSGVFDSGFECKEIGATLFVAARIEIERGASLAQFLIVENQPAELYNGNYQGEKDLK